ncbi:hypothetical protein D9611_002142 [Ephemerocybe angulata]|uniref:F-box domain-containing protein n=1 Tax=Ephemerocybe angulata TaxID=980116 RepID=A0A8H5FLJ4_9AGAR|nr:hypothetical protein D9611_002142 [Tulosesus angulatus]
MPPKGSRKKRTRQTKAVTGNAAGNEEAAPVALKNDSTSKVATGVTLTGLPFDLLSEIYALLHPVDLLQLARTSKVFRKVLMNRQASRKMIWLPALASIRGLPPCPKDLAEPRYINLLLESTCDGCSVTASRSSINTRVWKHLTNYSQTCGGPGGCDFPNFVHPHELPDDLPEDFETMVPASCYTFRRSLSRPELVTWRLADKNGDEVLLYDLDAVKALKEEYDLTKKGKARELWIERKKEEMRTKFQFFKACKDFLQTQIEEEREAEHKRMEALKDKRSEQIFKKLSEIGYAEECRTFFELNPKEYMAPEHVREYRRKLVPKELTDEEWPLIKESMVAFMKTAREHNSRNFKAKAVLARMDKMLKPAYAKYVFSKPPNTVVLTTAEISMMPECVRAPFATRGWVTYGGDKGDDDGDNEHGEEIMRTTTKGTDATTTAETRRVQRRRAWGQREWRQGNDSMESLRQESAGDCNAATRSHTASAGWSLDGIAGRTSIGTQSKFIHSLLQDFLSPFLTPSYDLLAGINDISHTTRAMPHRLAASILRMLGFFHAFSRISRREATDAEISQFGPTGHPRSPYIQLATLSSKTLEPIGSPLTQCHPA